MDISLRSYQRDMLSRLSSAWRSHRSVLVQMPTGTGKTHLMAAAVREHLPSRVLVVTHRRELVRQISATLSSFGIAHKVLGSKGTSREEQESRSCVLVSSIQKLRLGIPDWLHPSLVVIDEAHHALARTYRMLWDRWAGARFLGLTATPCRLDGSPFTDLFGTLLQSAPIHEFIGQGWLSDFEYVSARPDSIAMQRVGSLRRRGADGDYKVAEMAAVLDVPESISQLYESYLRFAFGRKGIVYAIDRKHARHIAEYYSSCGVRCCSIDSGTPSGERDRLTAAYKNGEIDVLVNVDIFSEGYDCPEVGFIQLARPTLSLSRYLQQVGRGMRVSAGKPHVIILDQVGLYQRFGLPTAERDWMPSFMGEERATDGSGLTRCVVCKEEEGDKELAHLEMVRIKRAGESGRGLEVFLQDGRYGVLRNGRVSCPARFVRVERLPEGCGYFALGVYGVPSGGVRGSLHPVSMSTVIDRKGVDLGIRLPGNVSLHGGVFRGEYVRGSVHVESWWDPVGGSYYDSFPGFHEAGGVEIGMGYEHGPSGVPCMRLRQSTGDVSPRFNEDEMYYNLHIVIARDYLIVKRDRNHSYRICGYMAGSVLVVGDGCAGYWQIRGDGSRVMEFSSLPAGVSRVIDVEGLGLRRVKGNGMQKKSKDNKK